MPIINPSNLHSLRTRKGWSLDRLAAESGVNRQTVHRIESKKSVKTRATTVERLAKALGTVVDVLCGPDVAASEEGAASTKKSQLNVRIPNDVRNALSLVAIRYGIKASTVVEAAPLMFLCFAEMSLRDRQEKLSMYRVKLEELEADTNLSHLYLSDLASPDVYLALKREEESIDQRDIFAGLVHELDEQAQYYGVPVVDSESNPFTRFMAGVARQCGQAQVDGWHPEWGPNYTLGEEEASRLVGADEEAVEHILQGRVALHELPKHLLRLSEAEGRKEWVLERGREWLDANPPMSIVELLDTFKMPGVGEEKE